jgi:hypothetical protein
VSGNLHASVLLYPVPFEKEAGWTPDTAWTFWRRDEYLASARNRTRYLLTRSLDKPNFMRLFGRLAVSKAVDFSLFSCSITVPSSFCVGLILLLLTHTTC